MKAVEETFNSLAPDYDAWFDSPEGDALFRAEAGAARLLAVGLKKPFLEIGVGTGRFAKELGIEFGIDPSVRMLELAIRRGIRVKKADGESIPFKDESFGGVFMLFTLCFVEDAEKALSEAGRVLKSGGGLVVGIINRESPWGRLYLKKKAEGHPIYKHARFYSPDEVCGMIERAGMKVQGYSSALYQSPSDAPLREEARNGAAEGAGFVCVRATK